MAKLQALGSIASEFSRGFMNARLARDQQAMAKRQEESDRVGRLFQVAERMEDPKMREAAFGAAVDAMNAFEEAKAKKPPKKGGVGAFFSRLLGRGDSEEQPGKMAGTDVAAAAIEGGLPKPPDPTLDDRGSMTFGSISNMFGDEVRRPAETISPRLNADGTPTPAPTTVPGPGPMPAVPTPADAISPRMVNASAVGPTASQTGGTPASNGMTGGRAPGVSPVTPVTPVTASAEATERWSPRQAIADATARNKTPRFGFSDPKAIEADAKQETIDMIEDMLGGVEHFLDSTPGAETMDQALNHPQIGKDFKDALSAVRQAQAYGLLPKDYLESWMTQRFPEQRPGYKPEEPLTLEDKVARGTASPEERGQWLQNIQDKAAKGQVLSPRETSYNMVWDQKLAQGKTPEQAYKEMEAMGQAPRQPLRDIVTIRNPQGQLEYAVITEGKQGYERLGVLAENDFDPKSLKSQRTIAGGLRTNPDGTFEMDPTVTTAEYDPVLVQNALKRGDISTSLLQLIIQETQDPTVKVSLEKILQNPFAAPTK